MSKMSIALKEANKTEYWISLLYQADYLEKKAFDSLSQDITEILKLLTSIINTTKNNINN
ncbi:MAG: four helix bundle protein [Crocosphaera sp.]